MTQTPYFKRWLASRFCSSLAKQIQALVVAWQVYQLTHSPLALGMIGLSEALPYVLVGLWAGHVADRYEKKRIMVGSIAGLFVCTMGLFLLSVFNVHGVPFIYLLLATASVIVSFELPASSSYLQTIIVKEHFPRAAAWNLAQFQVATIGGPILGGFILSKASPAVAYGVVAGLLLMAMVLAGALKPLPPVAREYAESTWQSVRSGIQFLMSQNIIFACMALDMLAVLFGDVIAILPVFAALLGVGPIGLGLLRAAPAAGSCLTSLIEANRPFIAIRWKSLLKVVVVFGISVIAFALSKSFVVALFCLFVSGLADGVSVIVRQSIYQANTPDHLRGRVASVSGIFIRISNELGGFESGLAATLLGPVPSVFFGGTMTLLVAFFMWRRYPRLDEASAISIAR